MTKKDAFLDVLHDPSWREATVAEMLKEVKRRHGVSMSENHAFAIRQQEQRRAKAEALLAKARDANAEIETPNADLPIFPVDGDRPFTSSEWFALLEQVRQCSERIGGLDRLAALCGQMRTFGMK